MGTGPADAGANDRDLHRFLLRGIRAATRRSRRTVSSTTDRVPSLDRPGIASVALASDGAGGLLYGERLTGRVRRVSSAGRLEPQPVVHVTVATGGATRTARGEHRPDTTDLRRVYGHRARSTDRGSPSRSCVPPRVGRTGELRARKRWAPRLRHETTAAHHRNRTPGTTSEGLGAEFAERQAPAPAPRRCADAAPHGAIRRLRQPLRVHADPVRGAVGRRPAFHS